MFKKIIILSIACVFIAAGVSIAEDRRPAEEEQELRERIEKLRARAYEHEEEAKILFGEANRIEGRLERKLKFSEPRSEREERSEYMREILQKITGLRKSAELAEKEGHQEKAHEFREEAKKLNDEFVEYMRERRVQETKERIEHMRRQAEEAKERGEIEKARDLWEKAEKLEHHQEMSRHIKELIELKRATEQAEREGHHDKANELKEKAKRMVEEFHAHLKESKERGTPEIKERIEWLRRKAEEAKEHGAMEKARDLWREAEELGQAVKREFKEQEIDKHLEGMGHEIKERIEWLRQKAAEAKEHGAMEKAKHLWNEAEELARGLKHEFEDREKDRHIDEIHHKIRELEEVAEKAEREGHHDHAEELHKEAHRLAMEIAETAHREKTHDMERDIEHLHALAREAKEAGRHEKAEAIFREAEDLKRHLMENTRPEREHKEGLEHQVDTLREEILRLREDIEQLENIIREKVMNR